MTSDLAETPIPELGAYSGNITSLYVTTGCYFIYTDGRLYRISRKSGEEEEWIDISSCDNLSFSDGWLYFIDENTDGYSGIYRVAADNFSDAADGFYTTNGYYTDPVIVGNYIYLLWHSDTTTRIYRYVSDLSDTNNAGTWIISDLVDADGQNAGNFAWQLNVIGDDLFFVAYNSVNDSYSMYRILGSSGYDWDFDYELVSSTFAVCPCITGNEGNYRLHFFDYDEEDDTMYSYYVTYN